MQDEAFMISEVNDPDICTAYRIGGG